MVQMLVLQIKERGKLLKSGSFGEVYGQLSESESLYAVFEREGGVEDAYCIFDATHVMWETTFYHYAQGTTYSNVRFYAVGNG